MIMENRDEMVSQEVIPLSLQTDKFYLCPYWLSFIWSFKKIYNPQAILLNALLAIFLESFS